MLSLKTRLKIAESYLRSIGDSNDIDTADLIAQAVAKIDWTEKPEAKRTANDGGPAFPCDSTKQFPTQVGMTLREYYAGQVLAAVIIADYGIGYSLAAEQAIGHANALIAELQK